MFFTLYLNIFLSMFLLYFGRLNLDFLEKPDIEDLIKSFDLIKRAQVWDPTAFCEALVASFTHRSTALLRR